MDIPLLKAVHKEMLALDAVVVVDASGEVRLERLVAQRGMSEEDVRARMAAQPTREERLEGADFVIDNSGDRGAPGRRGRPGLGRARAACPIGNRRRRTSPPSP